MIVISASISRPFISHSQLLASLYSHQLRRYHQPEDLLMSYCFISTFSTRLFPIFTTAFHFRRDISTPLSSHRHRMISLIEVRSPQHQPILHHHRPRQHNVEGIAIGRLSISFNRRRQPSFSDSRRYCAFGAAYATSVTPGRSGCVVFSTPRIAATEKATR